jgi:hypothetical protein
MKIANWLALPAILSMLAASVAQAGGSPGGVLGHHRLAQKGGQTYTTQTGGAPGGVLPRVAHKGGQG